MIPQYVCIRNGGEFTDPGCIGWAKNFVGGDRNFFHPQPRHRPPNPGLRPRRRSIPAVVLHRIRGCERPRERYEMKLRSCDGAVRRQTEANWARAAGRPDAQAGLTCLGDATGFSILCLVCSGEGAG